MPGDALWPQPLHLRVMEGDFPPKGQCLLECFLEFGPLGDSAATRESITTHEHMQSSGVVLPRTVIQQFGWKLFEMPDRGYGGVPQRVVSPQKTEMRMSPGQDVADGILGPRPRLGGHLLSGHRALMTDEGCDRAGHQGKDRSD